MQQVQSIKQLLVHIRRDVLGECIEACALAEFACVTCADACLGESPSAAVRDCVGLNLDCADVCALTGHLVSRAFAAEPKLVQAQLEICASLCAACEAECRKMAIAHSHCVMCAHACGHCEALCREAAKAVALQH
jgi:hypothetical protein